MDDKVLPPEHLAVKAVFKEIVEGLKIPKPPVKMAHSTRPRRGAVESLAGVRDQGPDPCP
jgi:hypothetical protein